jgi:hypothetical protein
MFYDSRYSQNDLDILKLIAIKKDIFDFAKFYSKSEARLKSFSGESIQKVSEEINESSVVESGIDEHMST